MYFAQTFEMNTLLNLEEDHTLEDERALLRPLQQEDFINLLPISLNEPDTWKYSLTNAAGEEGLKNYINIARSAKESGKEYPFIVFDKKANKYAGSTRFYDINLPFKTLQLGYTCMEKNSADPV